ncbi:hypothetical protein [Myroides marinus]|uniref:hypothetical protein n=1 Tax=Myroides marinus TaxID=703342 RepID=UPI002574A060|nr:hypothetical protein [Myroides marinus]MDM1376503.1 hypothetical protein [Myroides marinus]
MKTFYTLLKVRVNQLSEDSLTVGLILYNDLNFQVGFSKHKISAAKSLLDIDGRLLDLTLKEIHSKLLNSNQDLEKYRYSLLEVENQFNECYFEYLAKYSNGYLMFSQPKYIEVKNDEVNFKQLFKLFVDNTVETAEVIEDEKRLLEKEFIQRVEDNLIAKVVDRVHTHYKFDNNSIPTLLSSFDLDCVGQNGVLVGAKAMSFTHSKEKLHKGLNTYISVIAHLSTKYKKSLEKNDFYLIVDEPKQGTAEHVLWSQLRKSEDILKVIPSEEASIVADKIKDKKASVFI